ncbi:MAG: hypothetical protein JKX92_03250 [Porticoccaceae bacterium]|nr:hypothetical protein [Porticoccaceae bacterium]
MRIPLSGGCFCGALRYSINAQPWVAMDPALAKYPRDLPAECAGLPTPKNRRRRADTEG